LKLNRNIEAIKHLHHCMGHRSAKRLIALKKHGKAIAANLPSQMLKEYNYSCPICLASNKRRKTLPGSIKIDPALIPKFKKWEVVYFDTSGPWSTKSVRGNRYYTVFVDSDGEKIPIIHSKRKHAPIVLLKFVARIGGWPKTLYSDSAGEFKSQVLKTMILAKGCNHIKVPKGEHHAIGKAESAVSELDKMTRATLHDANLPFNVWDFVVEHMALLDSMTSYATNDPTQTIFESVYSVKPSFDSIPPVGCFGVRLECEKPSSFKLGAKNTSGVFLGYCNVDGVYGTVLMTGKGTFVVGKQQMAFDC
jgi:hypothetical protein